MYILSQLDKLTDNDDDGTWESTYEFHIIRINKLILGEKLYCGYFLELSIQIQRTYVWTYVRSVMSAAHFLQKYNILSLPFVIII